MKKIFMILAIITSLLFSETGEKLGYYENSSFGFSLQYPSNLLTKKTYPENGDGVWLENKSGTVILTPSGRYAIDTPSIVQAYKDTIKWKSEDNNIEITYKVQKKNWFVLSGYNHKYKTIFYEKRYFVYNRAEASNVIVGFDIEFPTKDKKKYNQLIDIVSKSFKPSNDFIDKSVNKSTKESITTQQNETKKPVKVVNDYEIKQDAGNGGTKASFEDIPKTCETGNAEECCNLGMMYATGGEGVTRDKQKAAQFYQKAADQGHAMALLLLGMMYANGEGVKQDNQKAIELLQKAHIKGEPLAQIFLEDIYKNGQGVGQDNQKAADYKDTVKAEDLKSEGILSKQTTEPTPIQNPSSHATEPTTLDNNPEMGITDNIKAWFEKKKVWLIGGALLFLYGLFKFLTRNKCTKCKSTNFAEKDRQHIKSYQKRTRESGGNNHGKLIVTQYDEYKISYICYDCNNIWTKRIIESQKL